MVEAAEAYSEWCRERDLCATHALVDPQPNRARTQTRASRPYERFLAGDPYQLMATRFLSSERSAIVARVRALLARSAREGIVHLPYLRGAGQQANRKLLEVERVSQNCVLTQDALDRLQHPTLETGGRAPGLRFGDTGVMALLHALCGFAHLPGGFRNRDLRPRVAALLGLDETTYTSGRMTYDLRRLRLKGLIHRIPGTTRYTATTYGLHVAFFYTKLFVRVLRPGWAALTPDPNAIPHPLRDALLQVDTLIQQLCDEANLEHVA